MTDLLFLLPICLAVSLVYEATHETEMSRIFKRGLRMFVVLSTGIILLAALMLLLGRYL